jgi:hypothetical protein
MTKNVK